MSNHDFRRWDGTPIPDWDDASATEAKADALMDAIEECEFRSFVHSVIVIVVMLVAIGGAYWAMRA
jgi:hypothetical protein